MKDLVLCSYLAIQLFHEFIKKKKIKIKTDKILVLRECKDSL